MKWKAWKNFLLSLSLLHQVKRSQKWNEGTAKIENKSQLIANFFFILSCSCRHSSECERDIFLINCKYFSREILHDESEEKNVKMARKELQKSKRIKKRRTIHEKSWLVVKMLGNRKWHRCHILFPLLFFSTNTEASFKFLVTANLCTIWRVYY